MSTLATLTALQPWDTSRTDINANFTALNTDKLETTAYTDATTNAAGKTRLSVSPASPTVPIAVGDNDPRVPTVAQVGYIPSTSQKDALVGTLGIPSTSNPYATKDTTDALSAAITAGIVGLVSVNRSFTAGGDIEANDSVYLSASNTVKQLNASAFSSAASTATNAGTLKQIFQYSNTQFVQVTGAQFSSDTALTIYAKSLDTAETTIANVASQTIETGGTEWAYMSRTCEIGTGKYLTIWQKETGANVASGIICVVTTFNGSTWSIGSEQVIESAGSVTNQMIIWCAKLDTDKALITYRKDSDSTLYGQVISVSGNTITTNTPAQISSRTGFVVVAEQITTDSVLVKYSVGTANYARVVSVSGTTITANAENTLTAQSSGAIGNIAKISTTKFLWCTTTAGTNINSYILTISGNTVTNGASLTTSAIWYATYIVPITIIGTTMALISGHNTSANTSLLDISWATPTLIQTTAMTGGGGSSSSGLCKIKPWTYIWAQDDDNMVLKLTPQTLRVGTAPSAIASAATGNVSMRYQTATLTGLTVGAMYIDDDAQPTINTSLTAPTLGTALTTTTILLQ